MDNLLKCGSVDSDRYTAGLATVGKLVNMADISHELDGADLAIQAVTTSSITEAEFHVIFRKSIDRSRLCISRQQSRFHASLG